MINSEGKEHLVEAVLEYCEDIVTVKDLNLNYVAYNKAFLKILGVDDDAQVVGHSVYEVLPRGCVEAVADNSKKAIDNLKSYTFTYVLERPCLSKIIKQTITPIIKNGRVESLLSISADVTNEESLKAQLIDKNYQMNTLISNLPFNVYIKDKNRNLAVATENSRNFVLNGVDSYANDIQIDIVEAGAETANEDNYVLQNGKALIKEKVAFDKNRKQHYYRVHKAPILNVNNEVNGLLTIAKNIDKEKQLENQKNLFLATLSHDLKNPLLAQISSLDMLYKKYADTFDADSREILELVIESSKYMKDMLYTLLKTCKESNGAIQLNRTYFDVDKVIQRSAKEISNWADSRGITIVIDSKLDGSAKLFADELQFKRVIGNLFNNAVNYAFENTTIKISASIESNCLKICVENTSEVIPEDLKPHIFDKYVCGNNLRNTNNIGLGLYFCRKIIEVHNGTIKLHANGTQNCFEVSIPLLTEKDAQLNEVVL